MRDKNEIQDKLEYLYSNRLKLRLRRYLRFGYRNCEYNCRLLLNNINEKIGCCRNEKLMEDGKIKICNNDEQAKSCPFFNNKWTRESVEQDFIKDISNPKICGQKEPKIAILLWVLHNNKEFPKEEKKVNLWEKIKTNIAKIARFVGCA